jgi:hypothetical protein
MALLPGPVPRLTNSPVLGALQIARAQLYHEEHHNLAGCQDLEKRCGPIIRHHLYRINVHVPCVRSTSSILPTPILVPHQGAVDHSEVPTEKLRASHLYVNAHLVVFLTNPLARLVVLDWREIIIRTFAKAKGKTKGCCTIIASM